MTFVRDINVDAPHATSTLMRHLPHKQVQHKYTLHNQILEEVQSAKCLGVTVTDNLGWGQHISEISSEASKTLGFIRRNLSLAP